MGGFIANAVAAVLAGVLMYLSFPPLPFWYAAPVGVAVLVGVLTNWTREPIRASTGLGYGFLAGVGLFVPLLPWIGMYVGPLPWLALALVCAGYVALFGLGTVWLWKLPRLLAVVAIPAWWVATEWIRSSFPFGGFPWGRLAFGQPDGALLPIAALIGAPGLSFMVALTGVGLLIAVSSIVRRNPQWIGVGAAAAIAPFVLALAFQPSVANANNSTNTLNVAAVQGNVPRLGLDFNAQRRAVLDNHVNRTLELAAAVRSGEATQPDVVIWPENSSDVDPFRSSEATERINAAAAAINAPIIVGAVIYNGDGTFSNSAIVWEPFTGPSDRHDKAIIQPFGEYMPMRDFFRLFSDFVDMAGNFVPGDSNWVVNAAGIPVGIATCFEVAFDRALTTAVRDGAQYLAVPTNNATFTTADSTDMTFQQLAMSQVRAAEHGRAVVVAATSGVSAVVRPDGTIEQQSGIFVPEVLTTEVPLHTDLTLATRLGPWPERVLVVFALAALAAVYVRRQPN
ncbi:apolipoprotein N-acyltransferase [Hoyosella rhizosphaerae]|nr:apolipoprotein N-acyltransferase [Hoyosella rhizosphaerae]MBN4926728.1 apolipoprotein N-acyltransferase [Hoyosella rhizosphaerae]